MKRIDCHVHIFEVLKGFNGKGEMRPIGGGLARWADGEVVRMLPPELGDKSFAVDTCYQLLKRNGVEKAVLLQGSFYGFHNEYVAEAVKNTRICSSAREPSTRLANTPTGFTTA